MKATYQTRPGLVVEVQGENQKELFREIAQAAEIFGEESCGLCSCTDLVPGHRVVDKYRFFEWRCAGCGARLSLGQLTEGEGLYPIRRLDASGKPDHKHGHAGKHRGWTLYRGDNGDPPAPATPPPTAKPPAAASPPPAEPKPGETISATQWDTIKASLVQSQIGQGTFLRWLGYAQPSAIPATAYDRLLQAARKPPEDLKATAAIPSKQPAAARK